VLCGSYDRALRIANRRDMAEVSVDLTALHVNVISRKIAEKGAPWPFHPVVMTLRGADLPSYYDII
jgi:hypothetical protein